MRLWGALPILATVAGVAIASSPVNAESLAERLFAEIRHDINDEFRFHHDDGDRLKDYKHIVVIYQ
ncbi:MAG: Phosphoesterase, partial [Tardiphaga sp.]|nr:Phosphoesterase [Tardiphaga sp.]